MTSNREVSDKRSFGAIGAAEFANFLLSNELDSNIARYWMYLNRFDNFYKDAKKHIEYLLANYFQIITTSTLICFTSAIVEVWIEIHHRRTLSCFLNWILSIFSYHVCFESKFILHSVIMHVLNPHSYYIFLT